MIGLIRFYSALALKKPTLKLSHELVGNFLQVIERDAGVPMKLLIDADQRQKNSSFSATLTVPLSSEIRSHFKISELTVSGIGKSHADAKRQAKINAVYELYSMLRDKVVGLPNTLINRINEIELAAGFNESVEEKSEASQFDDYEDALNFLTNFHSRIQMSVPVAASVQLNDRSGWKASLLGYLPKNTTLSGADECIRATVIADTQEASKKLVRIMYANKAYRLLASPESFLPKHLQSDQEKEAEDVKSKIATASISFDDEDTKTLRSFLDSYKEAFYAPLNEARQMMRSALHAFPTPSCFKGTEKFSSNCDALPKYSRNDLPIHAHFQQIMKSIDSNDITLTGSGKTTQLPQFIFSANKKESSFYPHMVMTQPRRIAAIAAASGIAHEMGQELGKNSSIGYAVRFETVKATNISQGSLNVCTSGVLLKRLQNDPNLSGITHIIIDEVHERDVTTDVLLLCLKQLLRNRRNSIKIVFMSATLVANKIADYFSFQGFSVGIPFDISGTNHPVKINYLEDIYQINKFPQFGKNMSRIAPQIEKESEEFIENELI